MSVMEKISKLSKNGCDEYVRIMMRLNVNLMERSIRNPRSTIVIFVQFFCGGKQFVPDDVMNAIRNEIQNRDNILYNYDIPLTIPILECILKRSKMMKYKNGIYDIFLK